MKITITNAEDAGMPENIQADCEFLIEKRLKDTGEIPAVGTEIDVLYNEADPRMEKQPWGNIDSDYAIYFLVGKTSPEGEKDLDKVELEMELVF